MGKPTICIGEKPRTKTQISFVVTAKLISAFVFATRIVQSPFFLNPKFQASSHLLCLYSPVCVRPVRKPHCWFSHEVAHLSVKKQSDLIIDLFATEKKYILKHVKVCSLHSLNKYQQPFICIHLKVTTTR